MSDTSLPASDEADPDKQSTPAGTMRDLEKKAEEEGAATGGDESGDAPD